MSWTNLALAPHWSNVSGFPAARVRVLTGISGSAELEGYLAYSGTSLVDVPVTTEASLPSGSYDPNGYHAIGGRCYNAAQGELGNCELQIDTNGTLGVGGYLPSGTAFVYFGDIYPTS